MLFRIPVSDTGPLTFQHYTITHHCIRAGCMCLGYGAVKASIPTYRMTYSDYLPRLSILRLNNMCV